LGPARLPNIFHETIARPRSRHMPGIPALWTRRSSGLAQCLPFR